MNEQTKIELLKIAATLTSIYAINGSEDAPKIKKTFEHFSTYLIENFNHLGTATPVTKSEKTD